jgi:molybdate transport system substrate-binding protein
MTRLRFVGAWFGRAALLAITGAAHGGEVQVAVASNFSAPMQRIADAFARDTGHRVLLSVGASGRFEAQIVNGAPFEVFLSADAETPARLEAAGAAVPGSRFTYAIGRLVLWAPVRRGDEDLKSILSGGSVHTLAIAKPAAAPYGAAALETLRALGIDTGGGLRIVQGENAAQAFQFVASGAAEAGFVALSQVLEYQSSSGTSIAHEIVEVDPSLHAPIEQQVVLLKQAASNADARDLLEFLRTDAAGRIIRAAGYVVPPR